VCRIVARIESMADKAWNIRTEFDPVREVWSAYDEREDVEVERATRHEAIRALADAVFQREEDRFIDREIGASESPAGKRRLTRDDQD
jgi:hypothetical protein